MRILSSSNFKSRVHAASPQLLAQPFKALTATAEARQLITRYIAKAGEQETRLEQLTKDKQE